MEQGKLSKLFCAFGLLIFLLGVAALAVGLVFFFKSRNDDPDDVVADVLEEFS